MAALHPTESALPFQVDSPEGRPQALESPAPATQRDVFDLIRPERMQPQIQRLRFVMRYMHKIMRITEEQAKQAAPQGATALPTIPPLPLEGGEYRLYYVSPVSLEFEKQYLARHNVKSLTQLLEVAEDIIGSYCGLIRNSGEGTHPLESTLLSMAEVLDIALQAVLSAHELYRFLEPVQTE